jgi:hypothetical protein
VTRPDYIARGGDLVMAPALELRGATMYSFLVGADPGALTRMVDAQLNAVTRASGTIYKPLAPMAAIVCADITQSFSKTPPDSEKGWMGERDFGVWIPVVAGTMVDGAWKPGRISWYLPYVFVDNVAAMVTGREVFGFFKQTAALAMPPSPSSPGMFAIDALVIPTFSPRSQAQTLRLMTLTSRESTAAPTGAWNRFEEAFAAIWDLVKRRFIDPASGPASGPAGGPASGPAITAWDLAKNLVTDLATGDVPMVFLKQFRDAGEPTKACYQAVIEAPSHLEKFHGGGLTYPHDVSITPCASHPIVAECGLAGPTLVAEVGFWCKMDFAMQPGKVVAESS